MTKNTIIEINGRRFDAKTGKPLANDGVLNPSPAKLTTKAVVSQPTMQDVVRHPASHATRHKPHVSRTLMRSAVKKPAKAQPAVRARGHVDHLAKSAVAVTPKQSAHRLDEARLTKSKSIGRSQLISHFSATNNVGQLATPAKVPMATTAVTTPTAAAPPAARQPAARQPKTSADLVEQALRHARSHEEPATKTKAKRRGRATYAAASVLVVAVVGAAVYAQLPNLKFRLISAKAGVAASLPAYQPSGYSLGQLSYSEGIVASQFKSNSDDRNYSLLQKKSSWDSRALRDSYVALRDQNYKTVEAAGRTIYLFNNDNATWVNGGIWYVIQGNGSLNQDQLIQLATSL